ncbi:unnamed protein product [Mycena citricolor]|uniref:Stress response protein rds1p n=1 Tax=Mycena citricolor TaxID=2018698 RepID=A0AAD2GZT8_9AGAR|nr:unnamed protein product [Mycena citricolor]
MHTTALTILSLLGLVSSLPIRRGLSEHLESAFYDQVLARFSPVDFTAAKFPAWTRGRFQQIQEHETTHVAFLSTALTTAGAKAVERCEYDFGITDVASAVSLSASLESVGSAAYTGAAQYINDKNYLTVAASILGIENRHAAWLASSALHGSAWDTSFQTALSPSQVYHIASKFIKSCPSSNSAILPSLASFASLTVSNAQPGKTATVDFPVPKDSTSQLFVAFISGVGAPVFSPVQNGQVQVPISLARTGSVYCVITRDGGRVDDDTIVAGPAIVQFPFGS